MPNYNCNCGDSAYTDTLSGLRRRVLIRLGFAAQLDNPPPGMVVLINDFLQTAQKQAYLRYPELGTERLFSWTMTPGERYYGIRENDEQTPYQSDSCTKVLEPKKISWVGFRDNNNTWVPLREGINPVRYTSDINTGWPDSYEIRQCIEVFPAPQQNYTLWVKGHFGLLPFAEDTDVTTIDPELVYLLALAMAKAHYQQSDAQTIFTQATNYMGQLTAGQHGLKRYVPGTVEIPPEAPPVFLPLVS